MSASNKLNFKTLEWKDDRLVILDQTRLPEEVVYSDCSTLKEVAVAIQDLKVRGAPAIGIAAAFGVVVGMRQQDLTDREPASDRTKVRYADHGYVLDEACKAEIHHLRSGPVQSKERQKSAAEPVGATLFQGKKVIEEDTIPVFRVLPESFPFYGKFSISFQILGFS